MTTYNLDWLSKQRNPAYCLFWMANRRKIVFDGNIAKFNNPRLKQILAKTGSTVLAEASHHDKI